MPGRRNGGQWRTECQPCSGHRLTTPVLRSVQADVYSFGVMLWEIVTGLVPTRGGLTDVTVPDECPAEIADLIQARMLLAVPSPARATQFGTDAACCCARGCTPIILIRIKYYQPSHGVRMHKPALSPVRKLDASATPGELRPDTPSRCFRAGVFAAGPDGTPDGEGVLRHHQAQPARGQRRAALGRLGSALRRGALPMRAPLRCRPPAIAALVPTVTLADSLALCHGACLRDPDRHDALTAGRTDQVPSFISTAYTGTDTSRGGSEVGDALPPTLKEPVVKEATEWEPRGGSPNPAAPRIEEA